MSDVLIIEPDKGLAAVIARALARQKRTSSIARTSQSAIELADKATPRAVILELLMPKHNGLEFIHEFRSYPEWFDIPIIIYSQISSDELSASPEIMKEMGIAGHYYKSTTSLENLLGQVERILE